MEELSVGSGSNLIDNSWLEIEEDGSWDVLSGTSLGEEGVEGVVAATDGLVGGHLAVRLDAVLEAVCKLAQNVSITAVIENVVIGAAGEAGSAGAKRTAGAGGRGQRCPRAAVKRPRASSRKSLPVTLPNRPNGIFDEAAGGTHRAPSRRYRSGYQTGPCEERRLRAF